MNSGSRDSQNGFGEDSQTPCQITYRNKAVCLHPPFSKPQFDVSLLAQLRASHNFRVWSTVQMQKAGMVQKLRSFVLPTFSHIIRRESMLVKPRSSSAGLNLRTGGGVRPGGSGGGPGGGGRLSRAMSFKHPERMGQIPPMELTRKLLLTLTFISCFFVTKKFTY